MLISTNDWNQNNRVIVMLLYLLATLGSVYCLGGRDQEVQQDERKEIMKFIDRYYQNFGSINIDQNQDYYYRNAISIYIQDDSSIGETYMVDDDNDLKYIQKIIIGWGDRLKHQIKNIVFSKQPYDVPEGDLYFIDLDVFYRNKKTYESFFLKKVEGNFFIYRYWIVYRSK